MRCCRDCMSGWVGYLGRIGLVLGMSKGAALESSDDF